MVGGTNVVDTGLKPVSTTARRINELRKSAGENVWQSRFHDHIIRNDHSLQRIRDYIVKNPESWHDDKFYN